MLCFARKLEGHTYTTVCFVDDSDILLRTWKIELFPTHVRDSAVPNPGGPTLDYGYFIIGPTSHLGYVSLWWKVSEFLHFYANGQMPPLLQVAPPTQQHHSHGSFCSLISNYLKVNLDAPF